ncbi:MAG: gamma-glutamylcyclotransferase [Deltaproteobacteria bacterium]|nr:gamma-glutamylcyclotransferase [Deltaproteobacteria bacterium]
MLVFAYGSTLDAEDYARRGFRLEHLRPAGRAVLPDYALRFCRHSHYWGGGVLGVVRSPGSLVDGLLYEVTAEGLRDLDRKEGGYERREVTVIDEAGAERQAHTYQCRDEGFVSPPAAYLAVVRRGRQAHGLDLGELERAATGARPSPLPVFVYGTLLAGERRGHVLAGLSRVPGRARGTLVDCGPYPGMIQGEGWVQGELVDVPSPPTFTRLDAIEGFPGFGRGGALFRRVLVDVEAEWPRPTPAWAYQLVEPGKAPPIPGGSWRARGVVDTGSAIADAIHRIRADVEGLDDAVVTAFDSDGDGEMTWGGADVAIASGRLGPPANDAWNRWLNLRVVVTPHARAAAWLILRLRDEVSPQGVQVDKYVFYAAIAEAIDRHHHEKGWSSQRGTLSAAVAAVEALAATG